MRSASLIFVFVFLPLMPLGGVVWAQEDARTGPNYPTLKIGGFSDFNFSASDEQDVDSSSGFSEGQFVLHFVSALSPQFSFFAEMSLTGTDDEYKTELERAIIKYDQSDYGKVSFGRFHTPINWWNFAFHHGQWLQTTVSRPEMTRFGGQFIPVHFVGAITDGAIPSGGANLHYTVGLGNGRSENIARGGDAGDDNNNRAWLVGLGLKPDRPHRLQCGGAYYRDKITPEIGEELRESIASAYVVWNRETPELIGEYAKIHRTGEVSGGSFDSEAYYLQAAYRLPFWQARLKPYARYERIDADEDDPVFTTLTDRNGFLAGARLDVATLVAVKLEYRHQRSNRDSYVDAIFAQISFAF